MKKTAFKKTRIAKGSLKKLFRLKNRLKKYSVRKKYSHHFLAALIVLISIFIVGTLFLKTLVLIAKKLDLDGIIPTFAVKTDSENHTNILLLGIGGENHSGGNLTDTIIIASLDHEGKYTAMLSIPRDLVVESEFGNTKINNIFEFAYQKYGTEAEGLENLRTIVEKTFQIPIHYYVKVDFTAFEKLVDAVGGIDVYLEKAFLDSAYPKGETIHYETFYLPAGNVHLDGEKALKYVRSRHSTSDFARSKRQQEVLSLIKEKALKIGFLSSPSNLKKLFNTYAENVDTNLKWDEIIALTNMADEFSSEKLNTFAIHNDPESAGGFLYVPDKRYFGNAYVLIPYSSTYKYLNYQEIQNFTRMFFYTPEFFSSNNTFTILNGTRRSNLAYFTKRLLTRYGFNVTNLDNARSKQLPITTTYLKNSHSQNFDNNILEMLQILISSTIKKEVPQEYLDVPSDVIIELGIDYYDFMNKNRSLFY